VYEHVADALASLSTRLPLGVFTAADTEAAELLLAATGLRTSLGPVLGADSVARPKPAPDGLIAVDNVFQGGRVVDPAEDAQNVVAIRRFNEHISSDRRVECVMVPIRDGVTLIRRV